MNFEENIRKLQAAQGDPEKLTLATVDVVLTTHEPELRATLEAAAIPHWFDTKILGRLLEADDATAGQFVEEVQGLPMVEAFASRNGWNVHEATRLALRNQLRKKEAERFRYLSSRASECFEGNDAPSRVETIYHRLVAAPEEAAGELEQLWKEWDNAGRYESLQALGVALAELIRTDHLTGPARARALVCFGWIRSAQLTLRRAEEFAREAVDIFHRLSHESGEADAHDQLGDILKTAGKLPEALAEYGLARQIAIGRAQRDPENVNLQRELSISYNKVGRVLEAQGDLAAALLEYQASKEILQKLISKSTNSSWQRELSISYICVGSVLHAQKDLAGALREYQAAREIRLHLAESDPLNTDWQQDLSITSNRIGLVLHAQGDLDGALEHYEAYRQIMLQLVDRDKENTGWQRELAVAHHCVGVVFESQGRLEEALREFEAANLIVESLANYDATNVQWQGDLATSRALLQRVRDSLAAKKDPLRAEE